MGQLDRDYSQWQMIQPTPRLVFQPPVIKHRNGTSPWLVPGFPHVWWHRRGFPTHPKATWALISPTALTACRPVCLRSIGRSLPPQALPKKSTKTQRKPVDIYHSSRFKPHEMSFPRCKMGGTWIFVNHLQGSSSHLMGNGSDNMSSNNQPGIMVSPCNRKNMTLDHPYYVNDLRISRRRMVQRPAQPSISPLSHWCQGWTAALHHLLQLFADLRRRRRSRNAWCRPAGCFCGRKHGEKHG